MRNEYNKFLKEGSLIIMPGVVIDSMEVYEELEKYIADSNYDVKSVGFDPYNAKEFIERWALENGELGIEKVIQGARTESVPLGEIKKLAEQRLLIFDQEIMKFTMGNSIVLEDTNGNIKLSKMRYDQKIDCVSAMMDAHVAFKLHREDY
jgi:phage terminase large subunit-like protein